MNRTDDYIDRWDGIGTGTNYNYTEHFTSTCSTETDNKKFTLGKFVLIFLLLCVLILGGSVVIKVAFLLYHMIREMLFIAKWLGILFIVFIFVIIFNL